MGQMILHSLHMHKIGAVSIIVSVALSVMILLTFGLVYGGVQQGIKTSQAQSGADVIAIPTDALNYIDDTELLYTGAPASVYMSADITEEIEGVEGVSQVSIQFYGQTLSSGCCSTTGETRLIGIDSQTDFIVSSLTSREAVESLGEHEVIVGSEVGGVTNNVLIIYDEPYDVVGVMAETGTGFDVSIIADIDLVRDLSRTLEGYAHFWEEHGDPDDLVSAVMIDLDDDDTDALTAVKARIRLSGIATPLVRSEIAEKSFSQLQSVFLLLFVAAIIMAVVTLLQLFARFYSSVWDRKSELSLYRAIGAAKAHIRTLIIGELGILVGVGLVIGIIAGIFAQTLLLGFLENSLAFPYLSLDAFSTMLLCVCIIVIFAVISFISIIIPLRQIGRLDPSLAIQQGDID